mgnify:CR=1 FL=1
MRAGGVKGRGVHMRRRNFFESAHKPILDLKKTFTLGTDA